MDTVNIVFDNNLPRQIVGIPIGTNCSPLLADFYEIDFMTTFSKDKQAEVLKLSIR